jgi:hypothetical protein
MALLEQVIAEVRTKKTGTTGDNRDGHERLG